MPTYSSKLYEVQNPITTVKSGEGNGKEWEIKIGKAAVGSVCRYGQEQTADHLAFRCEEIDYPEGWGRWEDVDARKWVEQQENGEEVDVLEEFFKSSRV
ncbi:hypothetical protein BDZ91DRAFT_803005 [Kalaharituber pfeilii]|nr:hypothetical protein BDZ91DRAFT_803005 [Kalaharituber pfeilii]